MEEESKKIKIKLTTIIILIVVAIIINGILLVKFGKDISGNRGIKENKTAQYENKTTQNEPNINDTQYKGPLSFEFLKLENKKENMVYSPLSIKYALQMLNEGAKGNTKAQIEKVIGNTQLTKYENIKDTLSLANALYIRDRYAQNVKEEYKNKLLNKYDAEIKNDEFKSADNMNKWIEDKTFRQIKNMIADDLVKDPNNEMFLINALAIDMEWKEKFDTEDTIMGKFYLENGSEMDTAMMHQTTKSENISYYDDNKITAISMDLKEYENNQLEFITIMPKDKLSNYVENFETEMLEDITNNLTSVSNSKSGVNISIPKFSFDYDLDLNKDLQQLGITDAFSETLADFSNMSNSELWLSGALHKANIDFTEKGVKAAAVTVMYMMDGYSGFSEEQLIEIKIDKPFMYIIRDKKTDEIWFVGTVYEPKSWEKEVSEYQYEN